MERILPAYPLFVKDPNFSIWSPGDRLNGSDTESWWGAKKKIYGFVRIGGETYCFMGRPEAFSASGVKAAEQLSVSVTAFTTDYTFRAGTATLKIRFVSPLPLTNPELFSLPVCYMEYEIGGTKEKTELSVFVHRAIAYNDIPATADKSVRGGVIAFDKKSGEKAGGFESAFMGLKRQLPLSNNDDAIGADWGYFYLSGERAYFLDEKDLAGYLARGLNGEETSGEQIGDFVCEGAERYIGSIGCAKSGVVMLGYDDVVSVDYYGDFRKGYYLENNTIADALEYVFANREEIDALLEAADGDLRKKAAPYGEAYYRILVASLRQSAAAHKLVRDKKGRILFLSKECCSNGCIATVDVSYPSMPLYLLYNPELVKGMMRPILDFAKMPVWTYDFAPHDAGTYPSCCGQVYGLNFDKTRFHGDYVKDSCPQTHFPLYTLPASFDAYDYNMQMPVEECANMLVMFLACYRADGDISFFGEERALADKWVDYLVKYGLKPENQLCTDDFAGHLRNNVNLAIKATVGIAAYAELISALAKDAGKEKTEKKAEYLATGKKYRAVAEDYAAQIAALGEKFSPMPLTWDSDGDTFSLKYNLAFDKLLGLGLFPQELLEKEAECYAEKCARFGTPLDSRKGYTKSDWLMWAAALTEDESKRQKFIAALDAFLRESPDRVPFSDWYETETGEHHYFRARSVQGGCFILLMRK